MRRANTAIIKDLYFPNEVRNNNLLTAVIENKLIIP